MAAVIVREGLDRRATSSREHTIGFDGAARRARAPSTSRRWRRAAGSTRDAIVETARGFAAAESAAIFYDLGVEQTPFSTLISYLIRVLLVLTDNLGRPGGSVFLEIVPAADAGSDRVSEPERALASGIPAIRALGNAGMFSPTLVPEEILVDHPERIRALDRRGREPDPLVLRRARAGARRASSSTCSS